MKVMEVLLKKNLPHFIRYLVTETSLMPNPLLSNVFRPNIQICASVKTGISRAPKRCCQNSFPLNLHQLRFSSSLRPFHTNSKYSIQWKKTTNSYPTTYCPIYKDSHRMFSSSAPWQDLTFEDLQALLRGEDIQLIDVREPKEVEECGHIPRAVNIPLGQVMDALQSSEEVFIEKYRMQKPLPYDANVVFYGLGPIKGRAAVELARKVGYKRARLYSGGWEDYATRTGLPLKK